MTARPTGTVSFLFTDIEGSTRLAREFPDTWESLRARHHLILRQAIESNHGVIFQIIGDAFCAAFHKAGDAIKAALQGQQGLQREPWGDCVIRVRMGIHTGEAETDGVDYRGYLTMSLVQRLMSAGHGGQILVSGATENLMRGQLPKGMELLDMGKHDFKDVPYPVRVFQAAAPDLQEEFPALRVLDVAPNNLPTQLTSFIGREKELADVKRLLANTHLLTLIGPGGTGKTRLSLQVAAEVLPSYPHGAWLIELAPVSDPASVPAATLAALDLPAEVHRPAIEMLCDYLREKDALLILDNCEHLVDACARMVDRLLHVAPKLRILASSREALGIAGEVSYRVPSLGLPDIQTQPTMTSLNQYEAVRLFIERAVAALPTFAVTNNNAPAVAQICHRLDGIPLALELAAAKVRALSVEQIAKRLDDRFRLLTGGSRTALERHQTLRAALDWSYNLLPEKEQALFRRLSIFLNGWTLEAAESVCFNELIVQEDIFELLEQLVNKSLVAAEDWQHETRYRMLETMRQYANEKLIEAGESETLRDKHLEYFLEVAETAEPHLIRQEQIEWLHRIEVDHDNLRLALEWALGKQSSQPSLRLCAALGQFWYIRNYFKEGAQWLARSLQKPFDPLIASERIARVRALHQDSAIAQVLDNLERVKISAEEGLALSEASADVRLLAMARYDMGLLNFRHMDLQAAYGFFQQSLAGFRTLKDPYWEAYCESWASGILVHQGKKTWEEANAPILKLARQAGERLFLAEALIGQAFWEWQNHQMKAAQEHLREAEDLYLQIGYKDYGVHDLLGLIAQSQGDFQQARYHYEQELQQLDVIGDKNMKSFVLRNLGVLARDEGQLDQAQVYAHQSLNLAREFGAQYPIGYHAAFAGQIEFLQGNLDSAKRLFAEALAIAMRLDNFHARYNAVCCVSFALVHVQPKFAVTSAAAIQADSRDNRKEVLVPVYQWEIDFVIEQARKILDDSAFRFAWAEGEKMTIDEALDLALQTLDKI